tara:strand:- start:329 stop:1393 length:1065 start_codon:yes stop_codon:yes gene_type:complete
MSKVLIKLLTGLNLFFLFTAPVNAADLFDIAINASTKQVKSFALVDTASKSPRVIEIDAENGNTLWSWNIPKDYVKTHNSKRPICQGASLELRQDGSFNVLIPNFGVVNVKRNKKHTVLVKDQHIDHAASELEDGSILFARGFVDKSEPSFMIKNPQNQVVWKWKPSDYFSTKNSFVHTDQTCRSAKRKASENNRDWAHANYVGSLDNGNYLLSMRNFSLFLEVDPNGKIVNKNNKVPGIHQPTSYLDGYIAADRNCGKQSIWVMSADGLHNKIFTGEFLTVRGIERMADDHFLITSATTISEISLDGKIHYKSHLKGVGAEEETKVTSSRKLTKVGVCAPKTLYHAIPTSFEE